MRERKLIAPEVDDDALDRVWASISDDGTDSEDLALEKMGNRPDPDQGGRFAGSSFDPSKLGAGKEYINYGAKGGSVDRATKKLFGVELTPNQLAGISGVIPRGSVIDVSVKGGMVLVSGGWGKEDDRTEDSVNGVTLAFHNSGGKLVMTIDDAHFAQQGKGFGSKMFASLVKNASGLGVSEIRGDLSRTTAAEAKEHGIRQENGYYSWPRFGFDGSVKGLGDKSMKVSELMKTDSGRKWWKENGTTFSGVFDLKPGSTSMKAWEAYRKAKGIR